MITVGTFYAKTHLSSLLEWVERGDEVVITRHDKAIARLVPVAAAERTELGAAIAKMKELRARTKLGRLSWRELRDEGLR